jgi:hypothetical protein
LELPTELQPYTTSTTASSSITTTTETTTTTNANEHTKKRNSNNKIKKPIAIYLPGLEGYGISACTNQFDDLSIQFELYRMVLAGVETNNVSYPQLVQAVVSYMQQKLVVAAKDDRTVVIIGESFGGLLATTCILQLQQQQSSSSPKSQQAQQQQQKSSSSFQTAFGGLILINPATSFGRTPWDRLVPLLTSLSSTLSSPTTKTIATSTLSSPGSATNDYDTNGNNNNNNNNSNGSSRGYSTTTIVTPYSLVGSFILSLLLPDQGQVQRLLTTIVAQGTDVLKQQQQQQQQQQIQQLQQNIQLTEQYLPATVLYHRVMNWLVPGSMIVTENLYKLFPQNIPSVVVGGGGGPGCTCTSITGGGGTGSIGTIAR